MRHPTRFSSPAFLLGLLAASTLIACVGADASSDRSKAGPVKVTAITAGLDHTCALTRAGGVKCWGYNGHDELGTGLGDSLSKSLTPVNVQGLSGGVTAISAGVRHSCALTSAGGVKCWGASYRGALGDGTTRRHFAPVDVSGLSSGVRGVAAGLDSACALLGTGGVKCWGYNAFGKLGDGTTDDRLTPVDVIGLSRGVTAIATGGLRSCAVLATGGVKCWGYSYGSAPVDVMGLTSGVTAISAGGPICVLTNTGGVKCLDRDHPSPIDIPGLSSGVRAVATNAGHGCALTSAHGVKCWGLNDFGQLGDGTTSDRSTPVDVSGLGRGVIGITAGGFYSCAVTSAWGAKCWGSNGAGALGDGTETRRLRPVDVVGLGLPSVRCIVPNVLGKPLANARTRILRAHCRVGNVKQVVSAKKKNTVVRERPRPGKRLKKGARINLEVSRG
jgi:Regulator of chromosome condensation (RCC1) repeat/PASTA domain